MATRDHTVRIRPSVPADGTLTPPSGDPPAMPPAWPVTVRHGTRADIALAVLALTRLRIDSERCRIAQARGFAAGQCCGRFPWRKRPAWARLSSASSSTPACSVTSPE